MIIEQKYKDYSIYSYEEKYIEIAKKILDKRFILKKKIKDTKRNYVALIEVESRKFIYKEPRNEYRIPQRQIMTFFKKGEALTTLINVNYLINDLKIKEYTKPLVAINIRKKRIIKFSAILFEHIENPKDLFQSDINILIKKLQIIHSLGYYHGDFNPSNFLIDKNNRIRILDTQGKKMGITKYRAHYDMLTMKENYSTMKYPYSKTFSFYLALMVKKFKKLKWVSWIKQKKKELRDKGWKI